MGHWWERNIIEPGKLPLLLTFAAFIVTFLVTRGITRLIRAGRGPFKNNVSGTGLHIHHAVPGVILLVTGGLLAVGCNGRSPWLELAGVLIGVGGSLVLDEFALILHLDDVYWNEQGRLSVEMVSLAVACMGLGLVGFSPFAVDSVGEAELSVRLAGAVGVIGNVFIVLFAVLKGKYRFALIGVFVPTFSATAAIRLARPGSRWARRYDERRLALATERARRFDERWDPLLRWFGDLVGGTPTDELDARKTAATRRLEAAETVTTDAQAGAPSALDGEPHRS